MKEVPLKCYRQLWSQLVCHDAIICHKVQSPTMQEVRLLVVVPKSQQKYFLKMTHEEFGHRVIDRILGRLSEMAYVVGQGQTWCITVAIAQDASSPSLQRTSLHLYNRSLQANHGSWWLWTS